MCGNKFLLPFTASRSNAGERILANRVVLAEQASPVTGRQLGGRLLGPAAGLLVRLGGAHRDHGRVLLQLRVGRVALFLQQAPRLDLREG